MAATASKRVCCPACTPQAVEELREWSARAMRDNRRRGHADVFFAGSAVRFMLDLLAAGSDLRESAHLAEAEARRLIGEWNQNRGREAGVELWLHATDEAIWEAVKRIES